MKKENTEKPRPPSRTSLREIPEVDLRQAKVQRNPYARRIASEGMSVQIGRGRPSKGKETGPTVPHSVRFPEKTWKQLEKRAKREGLTPHAALRMAVLRWLSNP